MRPEPDSSRQAPARVFFALWPDEPTVRRLDRLSGEAHADCGGRRMRRDTLHLTLAFIGDVPRDRLLQLFEVGDRVTPAAFTLQLDCVAGWRHNRIVWAGASIVPEALSGMVEPLNGALADAGFPVEQRKFAPHITLIRKAEREFARRAIAPPIEWPVAGFALMESVRNQDGARYVTLRHWAAQDSSLREN